MNGQMQSQLSEYIKECMAYWGVPGAAVSIIRGEDCLYKEMFGLADVDANEPVREDTVFQIGSITKTFTATLAAILVDEGVLDWDKPVREYCPEFSMGDPDTEAAITISHFLSHHSGLPPHNRFWHGAYDTRQDLFTRIGGLPLAWPLGTHFEYNNLNYMIAAAIMERCTGQTWEDMVTEKIFKPMGLASASLKKEGLLSSARKAKPYKLSAKGFETFDPLNIDAMAPAGAVNLDHKDLMAWTRMQLNGGSIGDRRLVSGINLAKLHTVHAHNADIFPVKFEEVPETNYGMGMFLEPYRGVDVHYHGGNVDGVVSVSMILPDDQIGISIQANMHEANFFLLSTVYRIIDLLKGLEPIDWNGRYMAEIEKFMAAEEEAYSQAEEKKQQDRVPGTSPSLPLAEYQGIYVHPAYGFLQVEEAQGTLTLRYHDNPSILKYFQNGRIPLTHYHYDVFQGIAEGLGSSFPVQVSFDVPKGGPVASITVPLEPLVAGICFIKE